MKLPLRATGRRRCGLPCRSMPREATRHARLTYQVKVLGCRVNHAEVREISTLLESRGMTRSPATKTPDLTVVHTCSVTSAAAAKSRNAIRRARKQGNDQINHQSTVIVTGCFTGTDPQKASELAGGADRIVPHRHTDGSGMMKRLEEKIDGWLGSHDPVTPTVPRNHGGGESTHHLPVLLPTQPAKHTRAEIRIQDGCDAFCTFCILPRVRGAVRSKSVSDVIEEAQRLVDLGHKEIVLSGIFLGAYGHTTALRRKQRDTDARPLADLLDAVASVPGLLRVRLSSLEPGDLTQELLDAMVANSEVVAAHLHLPLQSGSDRVLTRMNRQYRREQYVEAVAMATEQLRTIDGLPPALTTDIICGFPGETEHDFEQTCEVVEKARFLHMHVFPYSPRAGTASARWVHEQIDPKVSRQRVRYLIDREQDPINGLSLAYRQQLLNKRVRVIVEEQTANGVEGRCDHYVRIQLASDAARGTLVEASVTEVGPALTRAHATKSSLPLPILTSAI